MKIYILGIGALGSNIAVNLAFDRREDDLILVDRDKVETKNFRFGTQQYFPDQVGMTKVEALEFNLYKLARGRTVENTFLKNIDSLNWLYEDEYEDALFVDCLDNYEARRIVNTDTLTHQADCVHIGFSPKLTFEIQWNPDYLVPEDIHGDFDICEAEGARSFIQYVSGIATTAIIEFLKTGKKRNFVGNRFSCREVI